MHKLIGNHQTINIYSDVMAVIKKEYARLGIWVDNVSDDLRHHADFIVASNEDNGVAEVIERFILK